MGRGSKCGEVHGNELRSVGDCFQAAKGIEKVRFGISSVFPFRPHVEQMEYLARLVESGGHETRFLVCDADMPSCYNILLKGRAKVRTCTTCIVGGLRSYRGRHVTSFSKRNAVALSREAAVAIARSSVASLHRIEDLAEMSDPLVQAELEGLLPAMNIAYGSAKAWIEKEKLDVVLLFNGRMDATHAVLQAARDLGVPVITVERPWFGQGLQLVANESCLDLSAHHRIVREFDDLPLTETQARSAARQIAARYGSGSMPDWRVFHQGARKADWPTPAAKRRVLILPSSRGEVQYSPAWDFDYAKDLARAYDDILGSLGVVSTDVVLRAHPIWAQNVGRYDGRSPWKYYENLARTRGMHWIGPDQKVQTTSLIAQADVVLSVGGATGIESASLGKPVISVGPAVYSESKAFWSVSGRADLKNIESIFAMDPRERVRHTLRAIYSIESRVAQFVPFVRSISPTRYEYFTGGDVHQLLNMVKSGKLVADDKEHAADHTAEDRVLDQVMAADWDGLRYQPELAHGSRIDVQRRPALRWLDRAREMRPPGDRL